LEKYNIEKDIAAFIKKVGMWDDFAHWYCLAKIQNDIERHSRYWQRSDDDDDDDDYYYYYDN